MEVLDHIKKVALPMIEFIFPHHCLVCDSRMQDEQLEFICYKCLCSMPIAPEPDRIINELMDSFGEDDLAIDTAYSLFSSTDDHPFVNLIYNLKYHSFTRIGTEFGKLLGKALIQMDIPKYDLIIPVPIHKAKLRERGYNQSDFIAMGVSDVIEVPYSSIAVKRVKYTNSQTTMAAGQRQSNVSNIFEVPDKSQIQNKTILIVDDVLTTGSTVNSLADTLLMHGALRIDVAALMRA